MVLRFREKEPRGKFRHRLLLLLEGRERQKGIRIKKPPLFSSTAGR